MQIEICKVSFPYTVIDPRAMMIESFHTFVTNITVSGPARHYDFTVRAQRWQFKRLHQPHELLIACVYLHLGASRNLLVWLLNGPYINFNQRPISYPSLMSFLSLQSCWLWCTHTRSSLSSPLIDLPMNLSWADLSWTTCLIPLSWQTLDPWKWRW